MPGGSSNVRCTPADHVPGKNLVTPDDIIVVDSFCCKHSHLALRSHNLQYTKNGETYTFFERVLEDVENVRARERA